MKKIITFLLIISVVLSLSACAKEDSSSSSNTLKIGLDDTYPPMEYRNENNELVGFDVAFAKALGEELGVEVEFVSTAWDGIFSGLESEKYDAIISAVSITADRIENYEFSNPYLSNGQVIVVSAGDDSISVPSDLEGKNVGVQLETTADIASKKQKEETPFELTQYDDIIQTFSDLKTGRLDAIVVDYAVAIDYVSKSPEDYEITSAQLTNEPIAVCMKKGNTELKDKIDEALATLQENGTMKAISEEWLGGDYVSDIDTELR